MDNRPLGIFDSGVGGLAVLQEIKSLCPHEDILYYADSAHFPYGSQEPQVVQQLAMAATAALVDEGVKLVVVACNTASSAALSLLRQRYPIPFVGMVPAIKPASAGTRNGRVGVIATQGTLQGQVFADLVAQFAEGVTVLTQACPYLVEMVEDGETASPQVLCLLHRYLDPLLAQDIDTLVLGCTHYPFLRLAIEKVVGEGVTIIDASHAVAQQVERVLNSHHLNCQREGQGRVTFLTSGPQERFREVVARLLGPQALLSLTGSL
ncbi:MAG: glutamate racemase [Chloroflexi bacterium]|nr:glutamate racemase [Chloroflexota bacterium]